MNLRLVCKLLGVIAMLIGVTMVFSLPWAFPWLGQRARLELTSTPQFEARGFWALVISMGICFIVGYALWLSGKRVKNDKLYRKEAMAVVGLSWVLATILGALPYLLLESTYYAPAVRFLESKTGKLSPPHLYRFSLWDWQNQWLAVDENRLSQSELELLKRLSDQGAKGLAPTELTDQMKRSLKRLAVNPNWKKVLILPDEEPEAAEDRRGNYRIRWIPMPLTCALFESQSGFSTTGATVLCELEDPNLVPHCILFWRSSTHFLGGLGIVVLFVAVLGQGSAGKALMRSEMPGPSKEGMQTRMQHTAWIFAGIYIGLTLILTLILRLQGLTLFDALCHAFGTLATGGFSTWNKSLGHFNNAVIDYTVILFMIIAGTNFALLYLLLKGKPISLLRDVEWRTYMLIILGATLLIVVVGTVTGDFENLADSIRYGLFQVVAIITTTGYGTHDFDGWNNFGRGLLFLLLFIGGCAGSTGGGLKVIRHILFLKILRNETERAYHPTVVRPLRLGGEPIDDPDLKQNILVYFGLILVLFVFSWMFLVAIEPDLTWGSFKEDHKLIDAASSIAATLNNVGPGLGVVGSTSNYAFFSPVGKILFTWLMIAGRIEIFAILVLVMPSFWRD